MQHWISYASHTEGLLGVIIVEAEDVSDALDKGREIAPEAASRACGIEVCVTAGFPTKYLGRLITKPEINEIGEPIKFVGRRWGFASKPLLKEMLGRPAGGTTH